MPFKKYIGVLCFIVVIAVYGGVFYVYNWGIDSLYSGIREVVADTLEENKTEETEGLIFVPNFLDIHLLTSQRYLFTLTKALEKQLSILEGTGVVLMSEYWSYNKVFMSGANFVFDIQNQKIELPVSSYFFDIWNNKTDSASSGGIYSATGKTFQKSIKKIAITFDDGPSSKYTNVLLDILKKENVLATFYVLGNKVEQYPDILRREYTEWHEIGNHSYQHLNLTSMSGRTMQEDLYKTDQAIYAVIHQYPKTLRPPYGWVNLGIIEKSAMPIVLWSIDPRDWKTHSKKKNIAAIENVKSGDIIIMHDIHEESVASVADIIHILHEKWFTFVTVSDLLSLTESNTEIGKKCSKKGNCK